MSVPLAYLGIIIIWSTTPLTIKWSGEEVGFLFGVSARMVLAFVICLAIVLAWYKRLPFHRRALHVYIAVGLPLYVGMSAVYWGAQYLPSGIISVLFGLVPFFTGIFASVWLQEKSFNTPRVLGLLLGVSGLSIVFYKSIMIDETLLYGILAVLLGAMMHALGTVWVKSVTANFPIITANTGGLVVASSLFTLTWFTLDGVIPTTVPDYVAASIVYLGIAGSVFGALLFYYALKRVNANTMGLLPLITPVIALLLGRFVNQEVIEMETVVGTAIIISGLIIYQWSHKIVGLMSSVRKS